MTSPRAANGEEEVLEVLSREDWTVCASNCQSALSRLVFWPSLLQAGKGLLTAGAVKSVRYSGAKLLKMAASLMPR